MLLGRIGLGLSLAATVVACSDEAAAGHTTTGVVTEVASPEGGTERDAETQVPHTPPAGSTGGPAQPAQPVCTPGSEDEDADGDGFSEVEGDCEDCSEHINPGAYDFPGNGFDEDCSGTDATPEDARCDSELAVDSGSAEDAARAIGLCKFVSAESREWGVISARFTGANGEGTVASPERMAGMLREFGAALPREGAALLALSSGVARAPGQPDYSDDCAEISTQGNEPPEGYPKDSSSCEKGLFDGLLEGLFGPPTIRIYDQIALELEIRVPTNTGGLSFESNFYSHEYPAFICTPYNDFFIVLKTPQPELLADGNILFDSNGDPIGVNTGLLDVCTPGTYGGKEFACSQGTDLLEGTGFGLGESICGGGFEDEMEGAATGWLKTSAPAIRGTVIKLRFALWDTNDGLLDSTALIDNFQWAVETPVVIETVPLI